MSAPYIVKTTGDRASLLSELLTLRGIVTAADQAAFCSPNYDSLHDPLLLNTMAEACARILQAIEQKEQIVIFSDYDCDGIPGAVVLADAFKALGYDRVTNVIPHRHYEGFGLSVEAIEKIAATGATLVITIDCGTTDVAAVTAAHQLGVDVIITDHHEPGALLPDAVAIINPKLGNYPFPHLCGAAVAFKLAQTLLRSNIVALPNGHEKWWLDMVGIATIADMVPLVGENRIFAHYGLIVLRKSKRPGLQALLRKAKVPQQYLTEEDIGFTIGPRINAASRMDAPEHAFTLLSETDPVRAGTCVDRLEHLNNERKGLVASMTKEIHGRLKELGDSVPPVLVMGNPLWRPSLVGLAANKLAEEFRRPVFLWGRDGNSVIKGSCRSGGDVSVVRLMDAVASHFLEYGGHHASGGFSVIGEKIFTLPQVLTDAFYTLGHELTVAEALAVDAELVVDDIYGSVRGTLATMAPFGTGNPRPLFAFPRVVPRAVEAFGKVKEHTKITIPTTSGTVEAIAFFKLPTDFTVSPVVGEMCTILAHIEESYFMGRKQTRLRMIDIV
jgi:single-stranded-DNA-specific exonuclease